MNEQHPHITHLLKCLQFEFQEEERRYKEIQAAQLKTLVQQGLVLYPLTVSRKSFGFADYPEVTFRLSNFSGSHQFYNGASVELFCDQEEPIKGVLLSIENKSTECRLFAPDFPDWIEEKGVGMKLIPDQRALDIMKKALLSIPESPHVYPFSLAYERCHASPWAPSMDNLRNRFSSALRPLLTAGIESRNLIDPVLLHFAN